eukprot:gene5146-7166_t
MVRTVLEGAIEEYDKPRPKNYWLRNKKAKVDFLHGNPFAIDRQLEDLKLQSEVNKNPQYYATSKMDKLRSVQISKTAGASRPVAMKANAVNKFVREASGIHNYTIVPPPRIKDKKGQENDPDPETNPKMRPYAKEAKMKPILVSFGHRPRSASRTFHPATMKFRLKHGEIAKIDNPSRTGFGLPVAALAKILKAPKIEIPIESEHGKESPSMTSADNISFAESNSQFDHLFFSEKEKEFMFASKQSKKSSIMDDSGSQPSWISSIEQIDRKGKSSKNNKLEPIIDRPPWDEAFIVNFKNHAEEFKKKTGSIHTLQPLTLAERLTRYNSMAAMTEKKPHIFCSEKYATDKIIRAAEQSKPKSNMNMPADSDAPYDPWDQQLHEVKLSYKAVQNNRAKKLLAKEYQDSIATLPDISYFPTTLHAQNKHKQNLNATSHSSPIAYEHENEEGDVLYVDDTGAHLEEKYKAALLAARGGDTEALFNFTMNHPGVVNRTSVQTSFIFSPH